MKQLLIKCMASLGFILSLYTLNIATVMAHGEKALEPFIRMRTIQWYDVQWDKQKFNVNEEVSVSGKFHVAEDWPVSVPKPEAAFLNISTPGPVLIRTERYLNGKPFMNSVALQPGGDYNFKIVLKGRLPGRYHIHPFFNLKDAGQVMGPGVWLEITGSPSDFSNKVKTINGEVIDMETYGLGNGIFWHLFWGLLATAWLLWWLRRPLFIPRYRMLQAGGLEDELVTPNDRLIAKAMLVGVPLLVLAVNAMTISEYPNAIPLQASLDQILPLSAQVNAGVVDVETLKAEYRIPERSMEFTVKVNNRSENPVQIGEFSTANVHFLNKDLQAAYQGDSTSMTAFEGLSLENPAPIQPGEQRTMTITARDGFWESEKLNGLIRDADSRIGGLLFLYDSVTAARYISSITAAVIPKFN
ncbi:bacterial ammonia monooxygenase, subunit AmoB [Methylobacter tundripaludum]|uniref:Methane monooxygenase/ammonia monooxygenase, subunit B n=1 Tax=Methylobacter tundripaludum (strain ATCC BAA-1195 / DSM 17260 / SV96) TaxID=697282 RepID=G3IS43_METTV|nr:bacterial ammonia monooxygenase, subunit AmoB [Methylobacter tundripaludum]EGW22254.1 methane monooxygenase/ammonia monooxygenase, subunit B [Methylobacter tundripaludum SV96]